MRCTSLLLVIVFNRAVGVDDGVEEEDDDDDDAAPVLMNVFFNSFLSTDRKGDINSERATLTKKSLEAPPPLPL